MHPVFNPVAPYLYLLPNLHLSEANIANPDLLVCGSRTWISLDIARFYEEHCQPSSAQKTVIGPHCWGWEGSTQFARVCQTAVTAPPRVGCVVWRIVVIPSNHFLNGFPDPSQFTMARRTHYSTMQHRPLDSSQYSTMPPALRWCAPESWPCHQVSIFRVYKQCHKSWGELYVQSLFWLGSFKVFWSSKRSGVPSN